MLRLSWMITLLSICSVPGVAGAQAAPVPCAGDSARAGTAGAVVVIRASVTADEVTFRTQPRASAQLAGCGGPVVRVLERRNLPERVEPGATYRDVRIAVEIVGRVEASCLAALAGDGGLAAALGGGGCGMQVQAEPTRGAAPP
jgi:hypothetical protein